MSRVAFDTSALVALTYDEDLADAVAETLAGATERWISAATVVELGIVSLSRSGGKVGAHDILQRARLDVRPVDAVDAALAIGAWGRFGRGNRKARLNLGDLYSYALARRHDIPLVCVGEDFAATDLTVLPQVA